MQGRDADLLAVIADQGRRIAELEQIVSTRLGPQTPGAWTSYTPTLTSSGTQHGGQETTILGMITTLMHHGMVVVGLPYAFTGQTGVDEVKGGSPYGASTITGADGSRQPSKVELDACRYQGRHVAEIAAKLAK